MDPPSSPSRSKVHSRGNKRLDDVMDLVAFASRPMPLARLLDEAPRRIAGVFGADVCSLYLLEGGGHELTMRGNVGFRHEALGNVRLAIGEGITGQAVEYMRPISAALAAVVVQRHAVPFTEADIELLTVLGGLIAAGLRHAELIDANRDRAAPRRAGGGTRRITLPGRPVVFGRAIGAIAALRRPPQRPAAGSVPPASKKAD